MSTRDSSDKRPHLVLLGSGFAAFRLLKEVDLEAYAVTVVSPRNHFLFTPLLPSTTVGTIEFRSIIEPVRTAREGIRFHFASCTGIDFGAGRIDCKGSVDDKPFSENYDVLIIAIGAESNTFGVPGVQEHSLFLKELSDARAIRQGVIANFERAATPGISEEERNRLLHFAIVGGGPTGVEFAAELRDFLDDVEPWFGDLAKHARVTLIEASKELLGTFDKKLRDYTERLFRRERIDVHTSAKVKEVHGDRLELASGEEIACGMIVWSTGIGPRPLVHALSCEKDRRGNLVTDQYLRLLGQDHVYAMGDCASIKDNPFPATAQVAQSQGKYLAKALNAKSKGKEAKAFHYKNMGMLAYVGSNRALADLPQYKGSGFSAWIFWRSAYVTKLVSFKNKTLVLFDWFKAALFGRDISRF